MSEVIRWGPAKEVTEKMVCDGCAGLRTEYWKDYLDNDETDSGTLAVCEAAKKTITAYWHKGDQSPSWCPYSRPNTRYPPHPGC